ncbi:sensor domain-containing diguanylate cyclase [Pandoraea terrae]|uniref:Sensor domain-containing diguanylate cyclase n=1 Tax=Pandoraea terrae TaxID=1537710 RepID=A0A5E4TPW8_9BURK|nr:diguanylate cyclase [Pandoraea terrae]VVD89875.1 sensor domain-containing diguanylate cyclase [Pandoraea terrae]
MEFVTREVLANCIELLLDAVFLVDPVGRLVYVSPACEAILGYTSDELIGQSMINYVAKEDRDRTLEESKLVMAGIPRIGFENRYIHKDGHYVHLMWSARWSEEHGVRIGVARDVSAKKHAEAIQRATYAISEAAHDAPDLRTLAKEVRETLTSLIPLGAFAIAVRDEKSRSLQEVYQHCDDDGGRAVDWSSVQSICSSVIDSRQMKLIRASHIGDGISADDESADVTWAVLPMATAQRAVGVMMIRCPVGTIEPSMERQLLAFVCDQAALAIERKQLIDELYTAARFDELTGLPNRRTFRDFTIDALRRTQHNNEKLAVLFVDIDGFKNVNDSFGHAAGDALLKEAAARLHRLVNGYGMVARLAGDEFVVVIEDAIFVEKIDLVVKQLRTAVMEAFRLGTHDIVIRASVGVALYPDDAESFSELMQVADRRMYANKSRRDGDVGGILDWIR